LSHRKFMESFFRDYVRLYHEQGVLAYVNGAVAETLKPLGSLHGVQVGAVPDHWKALLRVAEENAESILERDEGTERIKRGLTQNKGSATLRAHPYA